MGHHMVIVLSLVNVFGRELPSASRVRHAGTPKEEEEEEGKPAPS